MVRRRKANTREALDLDRWFSPLEFTAVTTAVGVVFFFFLLSGGGSSCPEMLLTPITAPIS